MTFNKGKTVRQEWNWRETNEKVRKDHERKKAKKEIQLKQYADDVRTLMKRYASPRIMPETIQTISNV